jgi:hypothetical protein
MFDFSLGQSSDGSSALQSSPTGRAPEPNLDPKPEAEPKRAVFSPLTCLYVRDCNYHHEPVVIDFEEGLCPSPSPIRISTDLLFTGGFVDGLRLNPEWELDLRFVDEYGRVSMCEFGSHPPSRVVSFLPRGFVRLRFFSWDFSWWLLDAPPLKNERGVAYAVLGATDHEGRTHYFNFWVEEEIRGLFPAVLSEVT